MLDRIKRTEYRLSEKAINNADKEAEYNDKIINEKLILKYESKENEIRMNDKLPEEYQENFRDGEKNKNSQNKANHLSRKLSGETFDKNNFDIIKRHSKRSFSESKSSESETSPSRLIKKIT